MPPHLLWANLLVGVLIAIQLLEELLFRSQYLGMECQGFALLHTFRNRRPEIV